MVFKYKDTLKKWGKELVTMAVLIFVVTNLMSYLRAPDIQDKGLPALSSLLTNGKTFDMKEFDKKPVLIHFWATWCPTCKLEAANIEEISTHYNVITIAVKSGSNAKINTYLKDNDLSFKVVNDEDGSLSQRFLVQAYPTSFIYNKEHTLSFAEVGYTSTWGMYLRMWYAGL